MKGLEFAVLPHGHSMGDVGRVVAGASCGDARNTNPDGWMQFPFFSVLIKHPDLGYIMYDVGPGLGDDKDRLPQERQIINPAFFERGDYIDRQLQKLSISVNDISAIILSHTHWDHMGGLHFFTGTKAIANIYAPYKDFAEGLVQTHKAACGHSDLAYFRVNYEVPGAEFTLISEDMAFAPGIDIVMLEGHTPAIIGLVLHLESGVWILPSDAVNSCRNYGPPPVQPGIVYDSLGTVRTIEKLYRLEKQFGAKLLFPHDPWQWPEIRKAPYFYK